MNAQWVERSMRLEVIIEDGKCNGEYALAAARKLVEEDDVRVIYGGSCSDETLGMAPYTEENRVLLLSPLSSSDEITGAGDYVFRNFPTNSAQMDAMIDFLQPKGLRRFALLTADTDYAQDLRRSYLEDLPNIGGQIVADEVVAEGITNVDAEAARIAASMPDAVIVLPQTIPAARLFVTALHNAGVTAQGIGSDVVGLPETIAAYGKFLPGYYVPAGVFKSEGDAEFIAMQDDTDCDTGSYCAAAYDGVFLLGEALERCGDRDTNCMRDFLYSTQNWEGKYFGSISFDENGDIAGSFRIYRIEGGGDA